MAKHPLTFPCSRCGRRMGVGLELAGRRVRCPLCREVVTAPSRTVAPEPRPPADRGPDGAESIFADPEESHESVIGEAPSHRKPIPPSDTEVAPVTGRPAPRTAVPFIVKPPSSPDVQSPPPEEGSPFAGLGGDPPSANPVSVRLKRTPRGEGVPVWVWVIMAALAGYGLLMTAVAAWGWLR
ncbi:MAG TPA: hypothetical protein VFG68_03520 [Fimbriiglobus sp.]|nr:hypothetical protein [Fimbriiglobus sp.]